MKYRSQQTVYIKSLKAFGTIIGDNNPIIINNMYLVLLFSNFRIPKTSGLYEFSENEIETEY